MNETRWQQYAQNYREGELRFLKQLLFVLAHCSLQCAAPEMSLTDDEAATLIGLGEKLAAAMGDEEPEAEGEEEVDMADMEWQLARQWVISTGVSLDNRSIQSSESLLDFDFPFN